MLQETINKKIIKPIISRKLSPHFQLVRINQPVGSFLLLTSTFQGVFFASKGIPSLSWLLIFLIGALSMRGVGCIINDLVDMKIDRQVKRTMNRPLASGSLTIKDAFISLFFHFTIGFFCFLTLPLISQKICFFMIIFILVYPWMKRLTYWPNIFLGLTFNIGILISGSAIQETLTLPQLLLYFANVIWAIFFDTIYAHQDKVDDEKIGVKSAAILLKKHTKPFLLCASLALISLFCAIGILSFAPPIYYIGCILIMLHLIGQIVHVNLDDPDSCYKTFKSNQILGWIILINLTIIFYLR